MQGLGGAALLETQEISNRDTRTPEDTYRPEWGQASWPPTAELGEPGVGAELASALFAEPAFLSRLTAAPRRTRARNDTVGSLPAQPIWGRHFAVAAPAARGGARSGLADVQCAQARVCVDCFFGGHQGWGRSAAGSKWR